MSFLKELKKYTKENRHWIEEHSKSDTEQHLLWLKSAACEVLTGGAEYNIKLLNNSAYFSEILVNKLMLLAYRRGQEVEPTPDDYKEKYLTLVKKLEELTQDEY